jgi:hypothetical protein
VDAPRTLVLTAQQINLIRSVLDSRHRFDRPALPGPASSLKTVAPLERDELARFRSAWTANPVECIRVMNRAIGLVTEPRRRSRYLEAALDLEILMDRWARKKLAGKDLAGIPSYLVDGYTDLGVHASVDRLRRSERIFVDKERLRVELLTSKLQAIDGFPARQSARERLEVALLEIARSLRKSLRYDETQSKRRRDEDTVMLSDSVAERTVNCRHMAILVQLMLQEAGIHSRLANGMLRLFGLKLGHTWNVAQEGELFAIVDATFAENSGPLVLSGGSLDEIYQRAAKLHRTYCPGPESFHRYQIRDVDGHSRFPGSGDRLGSG